MIFLPIFQTIAGSEYAFVLCEQLNNALLHFFDLPVENMNFCYHVLLLPIVLTGSLLDTLPYIQWRNDAVRRKAFIYAASAY